jgi:hypothetical protein
MTPIDAILEIRHYIWMDREALKEGGLTSLLPAVRLMEDHLEFIDKKLNELTTEELSNGTV